MTRSGFIIKRIAAILFVAAVFFTASGFTFSPSAPMDFYAYVEFNVDGSGAVRATTKNLTLPKPAFYAQPHTIAGKTGVTGTTAWNDQNLGLLVDKGMFKDVHKVRATVEYYDAVGQPSGSSFYMQYATPSSYAQPNFKTAGTGQWVTQEIVLDGVEFANTPFVGGTSNICFRATHKAATTHGTEDTSDDYGWVLVRSIKIEPLEESYRLEQLETAAAPEWSFSGLKFTDETGGEIKELNAGGEFRTELTVNRTGGSGAADATLIVALMDENNKIERIAAWQTSIEPNQSKPMQVCFQNPEDVTGKTVRVMVWDSFTGLNLISNLLTCS